ncbi:MAG: creatininase family protein [Myxococcales bacterium]|nr:creatininase family protein [Myxococcales bacterium]
MIDPLSLPHDAARRLLAAGAPVWLPINPVEFHGPHLSLHNDHLLSVGIVRALHPRVAPEHPLLLCPDLELGVEPCPGPGSRAVPYGAVRRAVVEACDALADLGATNVALMTFHGAPLHAAALEAGVRRLTARGVRAVAPFNLALRMMLFMQLEDFDPVLAQVPEADRAAVRQELLFDFHAGFFETSLALHYAPDSVSPRYRALPPCPPVRPHRALAALGGMARRLGADTFAREMGFAAMGTAWSALRPFPGYTGRPHLATAAIGAGFAAMIEDGYTELVTQVFAGQATSPPPMMPWLPWVSLGGRLGNLHVPNDAVALLPVEGG